MAGTRTSWRSFISVGTIVSGVLMAALWSQLPEAEQYLRDSLAASTDAGTRVVLARTLAAQGRHPEAIAEAERALYEHKDPWPEDEPNVGQVKAWIGQWYEAKAAVGSQ